MKIFEEIFFTRTLRIFSSAPPPKLCFCLVFPFSFFSNRYRLLLLFRFLVAASRIEYVLVLSVGLLCIWHGLFCIFHSRWIAVWQYACKHTDKLWGVCVCVRSVYVYVLVDDGHPGYNHSAIVYSLLHMKKYCVHVLYHIFIRPGESHDCCCCSSSSFFSHRFCSIASIVSPFFHILHSDARDLALYHYLCTTSKMLSMAKKRHSFYTIRYRVYACVNVCAFCRIDTVWHCYLYYSISRFYS